MLPDRGGSVSKGLDGVSRGCRRRKSLNKEVARSHLETRVMPPTLGPSDKGAEFRARGEQPCNAVEVLVRSWQEFQ